MARLRASENEEGWAMKFRIKIRIVDGRGWAAWQTVTFFRRRKTQAKANQFARDVSRYGFTRRTQGGKRTVFYPAHRIWQIDVEAL